MDRREGTDNRHEPQAHASAAGALLYDGAVRSVTVQPRSLWLRVACGSGLFRCCSHVHFPSTAPPAPLEATYQVVELTSGLDMSRTNMYDVGGGAEHAMPLNYIDRPVSRRAALFRVYAEEPLFVNGSVSFGSLQSQIQQGKNPLAGEFRLNDGLT